MPALLSGHVQPMSVRSSAERWPDDRKNTSADNRTAAELDL